MGIPFFGVPVNIHPSKVLPLGPPNTDTSCWHQEPPDAAMDGMHHFDGDPTTEISTCPGLGLMSLGREADGHAFQRGPQLGAHKAVH